MENLVQFAAIIGLSAASGIILLARRYNRLSEFAAEPLILLTVFMVPVFTIFSYFPFLGQDNFSFSLVYFLPLVSWFLISILTHREARHERRQVIGTIIGLLIALIIFGIVMWDFILKVQK